MKQAVILILNGFASIVESLFISLLSLFEIKKTEFDAEFISPGHVASNFNKGLSLTGSKHITIKESFNNFLVCAQSGAGKSTSIIIPSLFNVTRGNATVICNDPSGELYNLVSGHIANTKTRITRIDFSDPTSFGFNALQHCHTTSAIQQLSKVILSNTQGETHGDKFWQTSAEMMITMFGRYLVFHAKPEMCTMSNLLRLVEKFSVDPQAVDRLIIRTGDEELINAYKATVAYSDRVLQSIIATVRASLFLFSDPSIIQTTSAANSIDLSRIRQEPNIIFICNPIPQVQYLKPLTALLIQSLFTQILSHLPKQNDLNVFFILDEIGNTRFQDLGMVISQCRKFRTSILLAFQDYESLVSLYGPEQAHVIKTNCYTQVFLPGQPLSTCRDLSTLLGQFTYEDEKKKTRHRPLMSIDELRMTDRAIILMGSSKPIRARMRPFYRHWQYRQFSKEPVYPLSKRDVSTPSFIQFD